MILLLTLIAGGSWFFQPANDMVNFYTTNRAQMNATLHKVTRMLNEADDILSMITDFKTFVTEKVMGALCQSRITRAVIGRFCKNVTGSLRKRQHHDPAPSQHSDISMGMSKPAGETSKSISGKNVSVQELVQLIQALHQLENNLE